MPEFSRKQVNYFSLGECLESPPYHTDRLFTGQRLDDTGLYYYNARLAPYRDTGYYDATIGIFISADSLIQIAPTRPDMQLTLMVSYSETNILTKTSQVLREGNFYKGGIFNPQLLNRYSHARNNPLRYNDASGHWIWTVVGGIIGAAVGLGAYALTH